MRLTTPPLPPRVEVETKAVLKRAIAANRALAELKGQGSIIPNQAMLVNSLVLQEAKACSEIENIVTTNDALFRAMAAAGGTVDPATKEVLRYREALWHGYTRIRKNARLDATPAKISPLRRPPRPSVLRLLRGYDARFWWPVCRLEENECRPFIVLFRDRATGWFSLLMSFL